MLPTPQLLSSMCYRDPPDELLRPRPSFPSYRKAREMFSKRVLSPHDFFLHLRQAASTASDQPLANAFIHELFNRFGNRFRTVRIDTENSLLDSE